MANASETNVGPMAPRVCVVGSVNMDLTFVVDALPRPGETVLAASLTRTPGGKGANQAVAAARAGAQVQFSGAFGDDPAAAQLRAHLRANAVGLDRTVTVPGPSGTAIIVVDASAENTVLVAPGANAHLTPVPSAVANCDVLLTQLEIPVATALAAARAARLLLVTPNLVALAGFILLVATLEVHVRRVEEPYLLRTHSAVYRGYTASVGRFVPGVGLIR